MPWAYFLKKKFPCNPRFLRYFFKFIGRRCLWFSFTWPNIIVYVPRLCCFCLKFFHNLATFFPRMRFCSRVSMNEPVHSAYSAAGYVFVVWHLLLLLLSHVMSFFYYSKYTCLVRICIVRNLDLCDFFKLHYVNDATCYHASQWLEK